MQDSGDRPQRRPALVARKLARLDIHIAALSEAEQGFLAEDGAGYTLLWSGKNKTELALWCRLMIEPLIARKLQNLPVAHSDRLMPLRLPIQDKSATLLSVYAPNMQAEIGMNEFSYRDLHNLLQQVDSKDKLLIFGAFNARIERHFKSWKGVLGRHENGNCNDNGRLLLEFCLEHQLVITNTLFQQRISSRHRGGAHAPTTDTSRLDYALTR